MSQGDSLAVAAGATMALILAFRSLRSMRLTGRAKLLMALAWVVVIVGGAAIASWWQA